MINPLDALSALTQQAQTQAGGQIPGMPNVTGFQPTGALQGSTATPFSEAMNLMHPIDATQAAQAASQANAPVMSHGAGGSSTWGHMVQQMVMDVNAKQTNAAQKVSDVLNGGPTPVHEAMVASEEATLSFEFLAEMRNKVVESYQTVMQMQV